MQSNLLSKLGFLWGIFGVVFILAKTIFRLIPHARELTTIQLDLHHLIFLVCFTTFMAYAEGYKGFQKKFSPRIISRAIYLKNNLTIPRLIFAPLFCMGYFYGTKKRLMVSYTLTVFIVLLVFLMNYVSQPWRGIVDLGVIIGLSWGTIAIICYFFIYLKQDKFDFSPETPDQP